MSIPKLRRAGNYVEATHDYEDGKNAKRAVMRVLRLFHPVRGEEVQLEMEVGRILKNNGKGSPRYDHMNAVMTMPATIAEQFACAVLGRVYVPASDTKAPGGQNVAFNGYEPRGYDKMTDNEKRIAREAFNAGYAARDAIQA